MSYNSLSSTGGAPHGPTLNGLVQSGSDLLKNMYDIKIFFPNSKTGVPNTGGSSDSAKTDDPDSIDYINYPLTVRAQGFTVPDVSVGSYDIKYHGIAVKRPNGNLEGDRSFELTFREDAAFRLREKFSAWLSAVGDPVTGGVSNSTQYYGTVEVATIGGNYYASTTTDGKNGGALIKPTGEEKGTPSDQILNSKGQITTALSSKKNPIALWRFYHVWVSKVGGVAFSTDATDANTMAVTFQYMDCDFPYFGGNTLTNIGTNGWEQASN